MAALPQATKPEYKDEEDNGLLEKAFTPDCSEQKFKDLISFLQKRQTMQSIIYAFLYGISQISTILLAIRVLTTPVG